MPSYPSLNLYNTDVVRRALSMVGKGHYKLGKGGRNPNSRFGPFNADGQSDCSGFTAWCLGHDRVQGLGTPAETWYDTATVLQDARLETLPLYEHVTRRMTVKPGDAIVYYGPDKGKRYGHIGIITEVLPGFFSARRDRTDWWKRLAVTHCTVTKPAVITTDARLWKDVGYIIRCNLVRYV